MLELADLGSLRQVLTAEDDETRALLDDQMRLSLARDRMGEKPLYWGWAGEDIVFASELKALRAHPQCSSAMSHTLLLPATELAGVVVLLLKQLSVL